MSVKFRRLVSSFLLCLSFCGSNSSAVKKHYFNSAKNVGIFKNKNRKFKKNRERKFAKSKQMKRVKNRIHKFVKINKNSGKENNILLEGARETNTKRSTYNFKDLCRKFFSSVKKHPVAYSTGVTGGAAGLSFVAWWASILRFGEDFNSDVFPSGDNCDEQLTKNVIKFDETKKDYSVLTAGARMIWDLITMKNAPERSRNSFKRRKKSTKGACWDVALAFDYVLMKMGCKHHHIVGWLLMWGIPHTFNLFYVEGKGWFMFDPLDGVGVFIKGRYDLCFIAYSQIKDGVSMWTSNDYLGNDCLNFAIKNPDDFIDKFKNEGKLKKYKEGNDKEKTSKYLKDECKGYYLESPLPPGNYEKHGWYVMEQINPSEERTVGKMRWAKLLPEANEDGSFARYGNGFVTTEDSGRPNKSYSIRENNSIIFRVDKGEKIDYRYHPFPFFN